MKKDIDFAELFPEVTKRLGGKKNMNKAIGTLFENMSLFACEDKDIAKMFMDVQARIEKEGASAELNKSRERLLEQIIFRFLKNNGYMLA